jgi:hypothetical protein
VDPLGSIPIGNVHKFEHVVGNGSFAVYRKVYQDDSGRSTYVIARIPSIKAYTEPPSSVLEEFADQASALEKFMSWVQDPVQTQPLSPWEKRHPDDSAQKEFDLGPLQTKAEVLQEALRHQLARGYAPKPGTP